MVRCELADAAADALLAADDEDETTVTVTYPAAALESEIERVRGAERSAFEADDLDKVIELRAQRKALEADLATEDRPSARHALEHFQNLEIRGGLGFGRGGDRWYVSYRDRMFDTQELLDAALDLHLAIRAAVDPEAFMDFRADYPIIEVRDPAEIVNPYNPGVEIRHRTDAAMAEMAKRNT